MHLELKKEKKYYTVNVNQSEIIVAMTFKVICCITQYIWYTYQFVI